MGRENCTSSSRKGCKNSKRQYLVNSQSTDERKQCGLCGVSVRSTRDSMGLCEAEVECFTPITGVASSPKLFTKS